MGRLWRVLLAVAVVACMAILAGPYGLGSASPAPLPQTLVPRRGGTIVFAIQHDIGTFNSALGEVAVEQQIGSKIFNGLLEWDDQFRPSPDLAESWETRDNGLTYVFRLRDGVKWHDGTPFTSADVLFTYQEILGKYKPVTTDLFKDVVERFEAPDPRTFIIRLKAPQPALLSLIQGRDAPILPKHLYQGTDILRNPANLRPVGTGPFKFERRTPGSEIVLVRNENYFKRGRPFIDGIIFRVVPDPTAGAIAFENGDLHYLASVYISRETFVRLEKKQGVVRLDAQNPPSIINLFMNVVDGNAVKNAKVRRAISVAIDRKQVVDLGQAGLGIPAVSCIPSEYEWAVNPAVKKWYSYNPKLAEQLLDEAGFPRQKNGVRFTLRFIFQSGNVNVEKPAEVIKAQLAKVGIAVDLQPLERALLLDNAFNKYNFDLYSHNYATQGDPALGIARTFVSTSIKQGQNFNNVSRYSNRHVDQLWEVGASSPDVNTRKKAYLLVQEIIARDMPTSALFTRSDVGLGSNKFYGLGWRPDRMSWDWVWWAQGREVSPGSYESFAPDLEKRLRAGAH